MNGRIVKNLDRNSRGVQEVLSQDSETFPNTAITKMTVTPRRQRNQMWTLIDNPPCDLSDNVALLGGMFDWENEFITR